jgi:multiple sugar transport system ATP-binding protein
MARIELDHVTKVYPGAVPAVNNLSLDIGDGDFMVLVGPSGWASHHRRAPLQP